MALRLIYVMVTKLLGWMAQHARSDADLHRRTRTPRHNPVAPATRSSAAATKASPPRRPPPPAAAQPPRTAHPPGHPGLRYADTEPPVPTLTQPTDTQRRAFELLHTPIPITLN